MNAPLVSICVPNLNKRPFLPERMECILAQTVTDWELIVCDSFSSDGSWEFFQKFKSDQRIHLYQVPREGLYAGWNECLRRATGRYIYIAPSDDSATPDILEKLIAPLERFPHVHVAVCDFQPIDSDGNPTEHRYRTNSLAFLGEWLRIPSLRDGKTEFLAHACLGTLWNTPASFLFRRKLLERTGLFRTDVGPSADEEWTMRAALASDIAFVPGRLGRYRIYEGQATKFTMNRTEIRTRLDLVASVIYDEHSGIPSEWKTVNDWDKHITRVWRMEYLDTFGLYRGNVLRHPARFLQNAASALAHEPGFLFSQARRGFPWSDKFSPDKVQTARELIELFRASWPPHPIPGTGALTVNLS